MRLIPSGPCGPMCTSSSCGRVRGRRGPGRPDRSAVASVSASLRRSRDRSARRDVAPGWLRLCSRVTGSTQPGSLAVKERMISTCSGPIDALGLGGGRLGEQRSQRFPGERLVRGPNSLASANRRAASLPEIRNRSVSTALSDLAPNSTGGGFALQAGDDPMLQGGHPPRHRLQLTEQLEQLAVGEPVAVQCGQLRGGRDVRGDRGGDPTRTHTRTLVRPTDKKARRCDY